MGANNKKKTTEQFAQEVKNINNNFEVIGKYINNKTKIEIKHNICGRIFKIKPNHFLERKRCPICTMENICPHNKKSENDFQKDLILNCNKEYRLVGKFIDYHTKVQLLHQKCNRIWEVAPSTFLYGIRCPYCNKNHSKIENVLLDYIHNNFPQYTIKKYRKKNKKENKMYEIDIFIPELNIGFEYNGIYWHSTLKKDKDYHKKKQQFFKSLEIDVYFLWEFWGEDECKNIIKHILTKDNQIESYPYIEQGTKYLYANKDLYPSNPPYIQGYKYLKETQRKKTVKMSDSHIFNIYNSGYYQYIKQ